MQRGRVRPPQQQPPPCRSTPPPSHGPATHTISGGKRPAGHSTQAGINSHTQRPAPDVSGRAITQHGPTRQQ